MKMSELNGSAMTRKQGLNAEAALLCVALQTALYIVNNAMGKQCSIYIGEALFGKVIFQLPFEVNITIAAMSVVPHLLLALYQATRSLYTAAFLAFFCQGVVKRTIYVYLACRHD